MAKSETIIFNGIKFRRYPESKHLSHRRYYSPGGNHAKRGIRALHVEIWKSVHGEVPKGGHIHHEDENPLNNDIGNLQLVTSKQHVALHPPNVKHVRRHMERIQPLTKEWHSSPEGREWHRQHGKEVMATREPIERTCEQCGTTYSTKSLDPNARFCSSKCKSKWRRDAGLDNIEQPCEECGSLFVSNKYDKVRFCSRSCAQQSRVHEQPCEECGKIFTTHESTLCAACATRDYRKEWYLRKKVQIL